MPKPLNPICSHSRDYACSSCGACDLCCECSMAGGQLPALEHVDSKVIAERWRVLRVMRADREARKVKSPA